MDLEHLEPVIKIFKVKDIDVGTINIPEGELDFTPEMKSLCGNMFYFSRDENCENLFKILDIKYNNRKLSDIKYNIRDCIFHRSWLEEVDFFKKHKKRFVKVTYE